MPGKRKRDSSSGGSSGKKPKLSIKTSAQQGKKKQYSSVGSVRVDDGESQPFPRGGQESLTPLEKRIIHQQAKQDALFNEEAAEEVKSVAKKKKPAIAAEVKVSSSGKKSKMLNIMNSKKLLPGCLVLGAVLEIHEFDMIVSLPFNMRGTVAISDVSEQFLERLKQEAEALEVDQDEATQSPLSLSVLFSVGQLVTCIVLSSDGQRVALSSNPALVNKHLTASDFKPGMIVPGSVKSIEDHGYIIEFGVEGKTGFLLKKNASEMTRGKGKPLALGQVIDCLVLPGADARAVPVTVNSSQLNSALLSADTLIGVTALLPGLLVNAAIKEVGANGLLMSFLGGIEGTVALRHLPTLTQLSTEKLHVKKKFKARVLWSDPTTKTFGLTLQKQLVSRKLCSFENMEVGDSFESTKVVGVDHIRGIYLNLGSDVIGYAPVWMLSDDHDKTTSKELIRSTHKTGTVHSCRIVQFNLIDGCPIVSLQASVLKKPYMRYSDLEAGEAVEGRVEKFGDFGMIVSLTDNIRGLCIRSHISDTRAIMRAPRKKYKEGSKVKARVLSVKPSENRMLLTCKKSLVRSEPLTSYSQASPGDVRQGVITAVREFGCVVGFFDNVRGLVMKSELGLEQHVSDLSTFFWVGQPVDCRVIDCDAESSRMLLSLNLDKTSAIPVADSALVGSLVSAEVTGIASNGINLKSPTTGEIFFLPTQHLSDYPFHCVHLLSRHQTLLDKSIKKGKSYMLESLLVLCERSGHTPSQVTLKKTLVRHSTDTGFISQFTDFKVGTVQPGVVRRLMPYGVFVQFPHNFSGLAPTKYLTNEFVSSPVGLYQEMQTVWAKVVEIDELNGKLALSLRATDLRPSAVIEEAGLRDETLEQFQQLIEERKAILKDLSKSSLNTESFGYLAKAFVPGSHVTGQVTGVGDHVTIALENGVMGRAHNISQNSVSEGDETTCTVLDIDLVDCCLVLSLNQQLCSSSSGRVLRSSKRKSIVKPSNITEATLEHKTPHYCVLSCESGAGHRLAYGMIPFGQLGVLPLDIKYLKTGQKVPTSLISSPEGEGEIPILLIKPTSSPSTTTKQTVYNVSQGDILNVRVHSLKPTHLEVRYYLLKGRIHASLSGNTEADVGSGSKRSVLRGVKKGDEIRARVVKIKEKPIQGLASKMGATIDVLELTTKPSLMDPSVAIDAETLLKKTFTSGEQVTAIITQVKSNGLQVAINPRAEGFVPLMLVSQTPELLELGRYYTVGQAVSCAVVDHQSTKSNIVRLSMIGAVEPSVGDVVLGEVYKMLPKQALLLSTPYGNGRVDITDISDTYTKDPLSSVGAKKGFIKCCLVSMDNGKLDFSLRPSRVGLGSKDGDLNIEKQDEEVESLADLQEGQVLQGYIKAATDIGVFVRLGRCVDGRVKIANLTDGFVKNFKKHFPVGQLVRAKVLSIDGVKGKVDLSLRLSHVDPKAAKKKRKEDEKKRLKEIKNKSSNGASDGESVELEIASDSSSEGELGGTVDSDESSDNEQLSSDEEQPMDSKPTLRLSGQFNWEDGGLVPPEAESSSEEEEDEQPAPKKTKRQKKAAQKAEEAKLYQTEQELLKTAKEPQSPEEFDRLLLGSPNDSALWVKYMSFYLHTTEVDKARTIAQRALKTISFREEKEKLNVWVGWMNLENLYGSQETLVKVFESALKENEPLEVFNRLLAIYQQTDKHDLAEQLFQSMIKRFSGQLRVWGQYGEFLMRRGKSEAARALLQKSLKKLKTKQEHVQMIRKFAELEFKFGEPERGKTMFESLVTSYPKRIDIWSTYIDMMIKLGDSKPVRSIFERTIHLKLSAQKMKFLFKRYLEFEERHGSPSQVKAVKSKARDYVQTMEQSRA